MRRASERKRFKSGFEARVPFPFNESKEITDTARMATLATNDQLSDISASHKITHIMALSSSDWLIRGNLMCKVKRYSQDK